MEQVYKKPDVLDERRDSNRQVLLESFERMKKDAFDYDENVVSSGCSKVSKLLYVLRRFGPKGLWGLLKVLPFSFGYTSKTFWGRPVKIILPESLTMPLYGSLHGFGNQRFIEFLIKNVKKDDVFYDIGAHIGFFSMVVAELIVSGEVHAFEPNPKVFPITKSNLSGRENCFVNQIALSEKKGDIDFYADIKMGSGISSIDIQGKQLHKIKVETTTLDAYGEGHAKPTIVKIDAEGAEKSIIDGGMNVFKESSPIVIMEFMRDVAHEEAVNALYAMGYKSYDFKKGGELERVEMKDFGVFDDFLFKK